MTTKAPKIPRLPRSKPLDQVGLPESEVVKPVLKIWMQRRGEDPVEVEQPLIGARLQQGYLQVKAPKNKDKE